MARPDRYLKTQQVADALGVGVSTLKRWVDAGEITATRTVGKHRLISLDEAFRFARTRELATSGLERLAGSEADSIVAVDDGTRSALVESLKGGDARRSRRLIEASHLALRGGAALADELIGPVMQAIGHGWSVGAWDVFHEHQASQIVSGVLTDLIARVTRGGDAPGPVALGASPDGDHYTLATLLGELTLRELGWQVKNLGASLPLRSMARAIEAYRPRLIFLAVSHLSDPIDFIESYSELEKTAHASGTAVVLGGLGLPRGVRSRLGDNALFGDRMADLAEFGRSLAHSALSAVPDAPRGTNSAASDILSNN